jgi:hypothetical protein
LQALSDLFMAKVFAAPQTLLAPADGLNEARVLFETARNRVLHQFVRPSALLCGGVRQFRFEVRGKVYFQRLINCSFRICHKQPTFTAV